ncbi:MAG: RNA pseudouridine synthase [Alphaproteobacteria bacterium]|nr:RNA pseudouridine synthase [Alphaproteobacteria bacterium]
MVDLPALILHRDASVLVINKPANIAVHKGFGDDDTLEKYFHQLQFGLPMVPQLAHRLDRATSGCLVLGRHKQALQRLQLLFSSQRIEKTYLAVVVGTPQEQGTIELKLAKQEKAKHRWWMKVDEAGQEARTDYKLLKTNGQISLVELSPKTGRTHQLRVHLAAIGHPILGEWVYNGEVKMPEKIPLQLHASSIVLPYHDKKPPIMAEAPLPEHMQLMLEKMA